MSSFWQFFDNQMAIFNFQEGQVHGRVSIWHSTMSQQPTLHLTVLVRKSQCTLCARLINSLRIVLLVFVCDSVCFLKEIAFDSFNCIRKVIFKIFGIDIEKNDKRTNISLCNRDVNTPPPPPHYLSITHTTHYRDVMFGSLLGQIGPKWDNCGTF